MEQRNDSADERLTSQPSDHEQSGSPAPPAFAGTTDSGVRPRTAVLLCSVWMLAVTFYEGAEPQKTSWHFFEDASKLLFATGTAAHRHGAGLELYLVHPKFQFGPFTVIVAQAIRLIGFGVDPIVASFAIGALAPLILWLALDAAQACRPTGVLLRPMPTFFGAICLPLYWWYLSVQSLHLDDALAIALTALALWGVARRRDIVVGIALGLAMASKPWAAAFVPLVFALPSGRRLRALVISASVVVVLWLPFVLGASGTIAALSKFRIGVVPESALRVLGVHSRMTPVWDRGAQVVLGALAGLWCARTGRWPAAVMVAGAVRIALDPAAHLYYVTGIALFVLAWELIIDRWPIPFVSMITAFALIVPHDLHWSMSVAGRFRLGVCIAVFFLGVIVTGPAEIDPRSGGTEPPPPQHLEESQNMVSA